jgi:hypothetical protein
VIPTARIGTGRDVAKYGYEVALEHLTYPVIVNQPAGAAAAG